MTKEELKDLVATKISGQGNQVDLGNALTTILNELIDTKPERAPITIDLSGYDLSHGVNVSEVLPNNYVPQQGDIIRYDVYDYLFMGIQRMVNNEFYYSSFGVFSGYEYSIITLEHNEYNSYNASYREL